jgi:hypothetical protein
MVALINVNINCQRLISNVSVNPLLSLSDYYYYYVIRFYVHLLANANAKIRRVNKIQIKQDGYQNKYDQSSEDNCNGKETFNLRFLDKKNYVFSRLRNMLRLGADVTYDGRSFHPSASTTGKDRSPSEKRRVRGTIKHCDDAERNPGRPA